MLRLSELRERLVDVPGRVRVMATVANRSGLLWQLHASGARVLVKAVTGGSTNPSLTYQVHAANSPEKIAVRWRDRAVTFREIEDAIQRLSGALARRGFARGQSILIMMKNRPEFIEAQCAAQRAGGAAVSVSWRSTASELVYLASHSGAKLVFFNVELWPTVEEASRSLPQLARDRFVAVGAAPGEVPPGVTRFEDLLGEAPLQDFMTGINGKGDGEAAVVVYTSGTTGKPKGAVRKFPKDVLPAALRFMALTPLRADDVHLVACPLYHSTALGFLIMSQILGATAVLMDEFKPEFFLRDVQHWGVTTTAVVPTMLHRVLALPPEVLLQFRTRSLRAIISGGAPLPAPLGLRVMDHFGDILYNFYGATETGLVTLANPQDLRAAPGTIGTPVPGNEIRLLDDAGVEVARGEVGELYVKNKMLVAGYHADEEATSASMRDGFFSVGDLARKDRDGRYFIEGRKRDMIISGGVNVYPAEVESTLETHPEISEVAVVGVEDPEWGERVRAFVVAAPGTTLDEGQLKIWTRERLAGPKVPRDFVFLPQLPRNATGKVVKRDLRNWRP